MTVSLCIGHTPNHARLDIGSLTLWFSYGTVIAFNASDGRGTIVRQNEWGPTTGKHLNAIDGGGSLAKSERLTGEEFRALLDPIIARVSSAEAVSA